MATTATNTPAAAASNASGMKKLRLVGHPNSVHSRRAQVVLEEKSLPYDLVEVNLFTGEHKQQPHLEKQPFGVVPVLEDDNLDEGLSMFESRAIIRYLASQYADHGVDLLGTSPANRAIVETWLEVESQNYDPAIRALVRELYFKRVFGMGDPDQQVVDDHKKKLQAVLSIYEKRLSSSKYLAGDSVSIADLSHLPYTQYLISKCEGFSEADVFGDFPHVLAWWQGLSSRPSWEKIKLTGFWPEPAAA